MSDSQRVWIPGRLPGLNEILHAAASRGRRSGRKPGKPWGAYDHMKRSWTLFVVQCCKDYKLQPMCKAHIECEWHEESRVRDPDNIAAGTKLILDGIVHAGVLPDDGWKNVLSLTHSFVRAGNEGSGVLVTLKSEAAHVVSEEDVRRGRCSSPDESGVRPEVRAELEDLALAASLRSPPSGNAPPRPIRQARRKRGWAPPRRRA